ncbi:MAG: hypothetical protein U0469_02070 [Candidatus Paceibacterota bacterium]|jgi:hypothetical protein
MTTKILSFVFSKKMFWILLAVSIFVIWNNSYVDSKEATLVQRCSVVYLVGSVLYGVWELFLYMFFRKRKTEN